MEKLGISLGFLLFQIANFLIVLVLLRAWAYDPIVKMLTERRNKIAKGLEDARVAAEARANAEKEAQKIISDAQAEANKRIQDSSARASKAEADARGAAEEEKKRILKAAEEEAMLKRDEVLKDLRGQIAALAVAAANKVIGESLDEKRQHALVEEFFSGVKGGKIVITDASASGGAAEVTSALPLTDAEKATIKKDLSASEVTYKVNPSILGGLVVRVGDRIIDGSVAGNLEGLRASLK